MELHSFSKNEPAGQHKFMKDDIGTRNTSEEYILGSESITKPVERSHIERGRVVKTPF
jgi:hypothetical protein